MKIFFYAIAFLVVALLATAFYLTGQSYRFANTVSLQAPYDFDQSILGFHDDLFIADLHADTFTFVDTFMQRKDYAHLDYHRAREGGFNLLTMAIATEVPIGMVRRTGNGVERGGNLIQAGSIGGLEPIRNWFSLLARGNWVIGNIHDTAEANPDQIILVTNRQDLEILINDFNAGNRTKIGLVLAVEGAHLLEGNLEQLNELHARGVRMLSLTHAFDNEYGGSSEGVERYGLTAEGEKVVGRATELGMIIDIAHASPALIDDLMQRVTTPAVYSHGGVRGTCDIDRNIADKVLQKVKENGGLIALGFWDRVICGDDIADIAAAFRYVADKIGVEHLALGSDFDGGVKTVTDASGLPLLTDALFDAGFSDLEIREIMGENYTRLLLNALPAP